MKIERVLAGAAVAAVGLLLAGCVSPDYYGDDYPGAGGSSMYDGPYGHLEARPSYGRPVHYERRAYRMRPVYVVRDGYYVYD